MWPFKKRLQIPKRPASLEPKRVEELIAFGARCGVAALKWGDLEIHYGQQAVVAAEHLQLADLTAPISTMAKGPEIPDHDKLQRESIEREEVMLRQERLAQMIVEDPVEAERMLLDEDMVETDDDIDSERSSNVNNE